MESPLNHIDLNDILCYTTPKMHKEKAKSQSLNRLGDLIGVTFLSERSDSSFAFPFSTTAYRNGEQVVFVQYIPGTGTKTWISTVGSTTEDAENRMTNLVVKAIAEAITSHEYMMKPVANTVEELAMKLLLKDYHITWMKRGE